MNADQAKAITDKAEAEMWRILEAEQEAFDKAEAGGYCADCGAKARGRCDKCFRQNWAAILETEEYPPPLAHLHEAG